MFQMERINWVGRKYELYFVSIIELLAWNKRWKGRHVDTRASSNLGTPTSLQWLLKSYVPCRQGMLNCRGRGFLRKAVVTAPGTVQKEKMLEMFSFPIAFSLRLLFMRAWSMPTVFLSFLAAWSSSCIWNIWPPYCISDFPHPLFLK